MLLAVPQDGYRQLAQLPPRALKGVVRVKFINEQVSVCPLCQVHQQAGQCVSSVSSSSTNRSVCALCVKFINKRVSVCPLCQVHQQTGQCVSSVSSSSTSGSVCVLCVKFINKQVSVCPLCQVHQQAGQ